MKKILGSKNIWGQKIWGQKKFRSKRIGSEIFFVKRNPGRVNPRGRIYDSPQKKVGLKFSWVVLSFPKRFFVKEKILVGLTLVGEGLMTPPPSENSMVKIVLDCC